MKSITKRKIISALLTLVIVASSLTFQYVNTKADPASTTELTVYGGMVLSKTVTETSDPTKYKITLGAYSTGEASTIENHVSKPVDIVVIVDQSGSMDFVLDKERDAGSGEQSRLDILKSALSGFVTNVYNDATTNKINHRIAIVGFSCNSEKSTFFYDDSYKGTEILIGSKHYNYSNSRYSETEEITTYTAYTGNKNSTYYSNGSNLYILADGTSNYQKVSVSYSGYGNSRVYSYTFGTTTLTSTGKNTVPSFSGYTFYQAETEEKAIMASDVYGKALQDVTKSTELANVQASVNELSAISGTYPSDSINMAKGIFEAHAADYASGERSKVVVFFTDGVVGDGNSGFNNTEGNETLANLKAVKDLGATVFTVGLFSAADGSTPNSLPSGDDTTSDDGQIDCQNRFLYLASSFYPTATAMNSTGSICTGYETKGYYMSPSDASGLEAAFERITTYIHTEYTEVNVTSKAELRDVITPYFVGPTDTSKITRYYLACTGVDPDDSRLRTFDTTKLDASDLTVRIDSYDETEESLLVGTVPNDTVIATDFDYKDNWCGLDSGTPRGKMVVLEFEVTVREGFLGGNGVPTNQAISGLYDENGNRMPGFEFPMPEPQDVPVQQFTIDVDATRKDVYLHNNLTMEQMNMGATVQVIKDGNVKGDKLLLDAENYGLPSWKVEYVDLTSTVSVEMPKNNVTEDFTYNMSATLAPSNAGTYAGASDTSETTDVWVYVPRIATQCITIEAGETPDYSDAIVQVDWVHYNESTKAWETSDNMLGTAPALKYEYAPVASATYGETHVDITKVLMDADHDGTYEYDVTADCIFEHDECEVEGCQYDAASDDFMVHVTNAKANIVIQNTGSTVDGNDTFVYYVTKKGDASYKQKVVIKGVNEKVILSVPVGTYTVTQDTDWSYRYTCTDDSQEMLLQGEKPEDRNNVFTFENTAKNDDNIRNAWNYIRNIFNSATEVVASN